MDYRKYAMDELRRVNGLRAAERVCRDRLAELSEELRSFRIPAPQADPVQGGGSKTEERWLNIIASRQDEERRLKNIRRRLRQFNTAWNTLTERDKMVLAEWYINNGKNCAENIAAKEHCDRATAYRWRDEAILYFARAYYGDVVT